MSTSVSLVWVTHMVRKSLFERAVRMETSCSDSWHAPTQVAGRTCQAAGAAARAPQRQMRSATCWAGAYWTAERAAPLQPLRRSVTLLPLV